MNTSPRILFVDHAAVLGGAELSLLDIAIAFRERAAVALFEDGPFAARLVQAGVAVIPISAGGALKRVKKSSRLPGLMAVMALARTAFSLAHVARPFSLLYANSPKSFLAAAVAGVLVRKPVIWHLRDILDRAHFSAANIATLIRVANARAVRVIANSRATAAAFIDAGGRADLVRVVYNGIDAAPFDAVSKDVRNAIRRSLGIGSDTYLIGSFSRLHAWKGQQVLLDALELHPDVHALIVGGALFSGEAEFERELRGRANRGPLAGRIHILGARNDIPQLIAACDAVAHTSVLPEPFGRAVVEALLSNRPLIATNAGGVREIVRDAETALLTTPGDAEALSQAIDFLRADPAGAVERTTRGSSEMRVRFTLEAMLAGVEREIDFALGVIP